MELDEQYEEVDPEKLERFIDELTLRDAFFKQLIQRNGCNYSDGKFLGDQSYEASLEAWERAGLKKEELDEKIIEWAEHKGQVKLIFKSLARNGDDEGYRVAWEEDLPRLSRTYTVLESGDWIPTLQRLGKVHNYE